MSFVEDAMKQRVNIELIIRSDYFSVSFIFSEAEVIKLIMFQ